MPAYNVYILYSRKLNRFYKGHTANLAERLRYHNAGYEESTKAGMPWVLMWATTKASKNEAVKLELKLKNLSRMRLLSFMVKYGDGIEDSGARGIIEQLMESSSH